MNNITRTPINDGRPTDEMKKVAKHTMKTIRKHLTKKHPELGSRAPVGKIEYCVSADRSKFNPDAADDDYEHEMTVNPYIARSFTRLNEQAPDIYNEDLVDELCEIINTDPALPDTVLAFPSPHNDAREALNLIIVVGTVPLREGHVNDGSFARVEDAIEPLDVPEPLPAPPRVGSKTHPLNLLR